MTKTSVKYLKTSFAIDFIPVIPLQNLSMINNRNCLFYLIKCVRLIKGFKILNEQEIMGKIKLIYKKNLLIKMEKNPLVKHDKLRDHNKVEEQLLIYFSIKITKLVIIILNFSYMFGMFWYIMCKLVEDMGGWDYDNPDHTEANARTFIVYYGLEQEREKNSEVFLISALVYFAFTSLSTVGFGDFAPRSDLERLVGAFLLLSGVAIFSIIMGQFIEILDSYSKFNEENNDGDRLSRFFGVLTHYNKNFPLDP
jgi:hypothetical protein